MRAEHTAAIVEVRTDAGLVGIGETYAGAFVPHTVPPLVDRFAALLTGRSIDADDPAAELRRLRRETAFWASAGLGAGVLAGVEAALWDLCGKALQLPVYRLLGGPQHDRLPVLVTGGVARQPAGELLRAIERHLDRGFAGVRLGVDEDDDLAALLAQLRDRLGPGPELAFDCHMELRPPDRRWDVAAAADVLAAAAPYRPLYVEEPLVYDDPAAYAALRNASDVLVAGGERLASHAEFAPWLRAGAFGVAQPDASWAGLTDLLAVAAGGVPIAPHSWSAGVGTLQNIHAGFACASTLALELPPSPGPLHTELWGDAVTVRDGRLLPPEAPGWGARLTDDVKDWFALR
nr:mandelate racemase/muconate lactonizing enzyme family protein [Jiangella mangrovi]